MFKIVIYLFSNFDAICGHIIRESCHYAEDPWQWFTDYTDMMDIAHCVNYI
jgi:hypothetical protein